MRYATMLTPDEMKALLKAIPRLEAYADKWTSLPYGISALIETKADYSDAEDYLETVYGAELRQAPIPHWYGWNINHEVYTCVVVLKNPTRHDFEQLEALAFEMTNALTPEENTGDVLSVILTTNDEEDAWQMAEEFEHVVMVLLDR